MFARRGEAAFREIEEEAAVEALSATRAEGDRPRRRRGRLGGDQSARSASARSRCSSRSTPTRPGARSRERPPARAGRGGVPAAVRGAPAALRGGRRRGRAATPTTSCSPPAASTSSVGSLERARRARARRRLRRARGGCARGGDLRRRRPARARAPARLDARGAAPARRRRRPRSASGSGASSGSTAAAPSSRSAAAARPTWPASPPPPTCAASPGRRCRRRSSARSTRRSAARRRSTFPRGRTSSAPSTGPPRTVIDPAAARDAAGRRAARGMAEVVKTGLLAGERLWELPDAELVRRCAAFKTAVCLRDPHDRGERAMLNLGHTFAHALEAAAGYDAARTARRSRSDCLRRSALRALGSTRPSSRSRRCWRRSPCRVDLDRAWAALGRDKKAEAAASALVLLERPGAASRRGAAGRRRAARARALIAGRVAPMRVDVLNGVNLDVLGRRDPAALRGAHAARSSRRGSTGGRSELGCTVRCRQTNHEGEYVDWLPRGARLAPTASIVNPARVDALQLGDPRRRRALEAPVVEVHLPTSTSARSGGGMSRRSPTSRASASSARARTATARRSSSWPGAQ